MQNSKEAGLERIIGSDKSTKSAESTENAEQLFTDSVNYLLHLACTCQVRGGFQLEEAVALNNVKGLVESNAAPDVDQLMLLQRLTLISQKNGTLQLPEAWSAYNAIQIIERYNSRKK